MRKGASALMALILLSHTCWMPGYSDAGEYRSIEQRVRASVRIRDLPPVSREVAAAMFGHVVRTRNAAGELRDTLYKLIGADAPLRPYLDLPLGLIDPKIQAVSLQIEVLEKNVGPDPAGSTLPDDELLNALGSLSIAYQQLARLHDLRDRLTSGDVAALRAKESGDGQKLKALLAERDRLAESAFRARFGLAEQEEIYRLQVQLLVNGLGREQVTKEYDEVNRQLVKMRRRAGGAGIGTGEAAEPVRRLVEGRRRLLSGYLAGMESSSFGAGSRLLVPLPAQAERISSVLAEWEEIRRDLMQSVASRAEIAIRLRPRLQERNRLLTAMREEAGKSDNFPLYLMQLLVDAQEEQLRNVATLWNQISPDLKSQSRKYPAIKSDGFYEKVADMGIALDALQKLETRVLAGMSPFIADLIPSIDGPRADAVAQRLRELTRRMEEDRKDIAGLSALAGKEARTWGRFDVWLASLMEARIGLWSRAQAALNRGGSRDAGNSLAYSLQALAGERIAGARADLERLREMRGESARDPVMRSLYGPEKGTEWVSHAAGGDAVQQGLRELLRESGILDDLGRAGGPGQPAEARAAAVARLAEGLAFPWILIERGGGMDFAVQVAASEFVVEGIDGPAPRLKEKPSVDYQVDRGVRYASLDLDQILLAASAASNASQQGTPGLLSNVWNGVGNQARKSWLTYAIIVGGGLAAAAVAGPVLGATAVATAILSGTVLATGGQAWQDANFGTMKGISRTVSTPEVYDRAVKNLDMGETGVNVALGFYGIGKGAAGLLKAGQSAASEVRTAETVLARVNEEVAVTSEIRKLNTKGWESVRDYWIKRAGSAENVFESTEARDQLHQALQKIVRSERKAIDAAAEGVKATEVAQRSLDAVKDAYRRMVFGVRSLVDTADDARKVARGADTAEVIGGIGTLSGPVSDAMPVTPENRRSIDEQEKTKLDQIRKWQQAAKPPPKKEPPVTPLPPPPKKEPPDEGAIQEDASKGGSEYDPVKAFAEREQKRSDEVGGRGLSAGTGIGQFGPSTEKPGDPYKRPPEPLPVKPPTPPEPLPVKPPTPPEPPPVKPPTPPTPPPVKPPTPPVKPPVKPPTPPVKPPVSGGGGGSAALGPYQWYRLVAVATFEKLDLSSGTAVGARQVTCTFTIYVVGSARSQSELEEGLRSHGKEALSIAAVSGRNAKLISTSVVAGPSSSELKTPTPNFTLKCP